MRRNIFEIINQNNNFGYDIDRIKRLTEDENIIHYYYEQSLFDFFESYCFSCWKQRGHFVDFNDLLHVVDFEKLKINAYLDDDSFITYIEFICNIITLSNIKMSDLRKQGKECNTTRDFTLLEKIIKDLLSQYNQKQVYFENEEKVIIVEDKPEVTAVA